MKIATFENSIASYDNAVATLSSVRNAEITAAGASVQEPN
jgi:hypothetical protein